MARAKPLDFRTKRVDIRRQTKRDRTVYSAQVTGDMIYDARTLRAPSPSYLKLTIVSFRTTQHVLHERCRALQVEKSEFKRAHRAKVDPFRIPGRLRNNHLVLAYRK